MITQSPQNQATRGDRQSYGVTANHPIYARPDKWNITFTEAVEYSEKLVQAGFKSVTIREQGSGVLASQSPTLTQENQKETDEALMGDIL